MREMVAAKAGGGDVVEVGTVVDVSAVVVGRCGELVQGAATDGPPQAAATASSADVTIWVDPRTGSSSRALAPRFRIRHRGARLRNAGRSRPEE